MQMSNKGVGFFIFSHGITDEKALTKKFPAKLYYELHSKS